MPIWALEPLDWDPNGRASIYMGQVIVRVVRCRVGFVLSAFDQ